MKNTRNITTKTILTALAFIFAFSICFFSQAINTAVAYKSQISLANADFESELLSSGWAISGTKQNDAILEKSSTAHNGNYSLVISSEQDTNYGAKTTYTTKLEANKYYVLSVWAKVDSISTKFSYGFSGDIEKEITIDSNSTDWTQYKLFVETNSTTSSNVAIELWLGSLNGTTKSSGAVYFDDVDITNIDRAQFLKAKENSEATISKQDIYESATQSISLLNLDNSTKWSLTRADGETSSTQSAAPTDYIFNDGTDEQYSSKVIIANNSSSTKSLTLSSGVFTLEKLGLYRISILVKAETDSAKFDLKLSNGTISKSQSISSLAKSTTNNTFNNYTEYTFFVRTGTSLESLTLSIALKPESTIYIDNAKVENSNYSDYSAATSTKKLDLLKNTDNTLNGFFNQVESNSSSAPQKAVLWETFGTATMGIVMPTDEHYTINSVNVPIPTCYKISSDLQTFAGIKSSTISIKTSSPIAKISVWVKTEDGASATIKLYQSSNLVATSKNISTESEWQQISFYVKTSTALSLNMQLALGESENNKSAGSVYFYAATANTTTNSDTFSNQKSKNNPNDYFWDNSTYFSHNGIQQNGVYELFAANYAIASEVVNSFGGALDLEQIDESSAFFAHKDNLKNPEGNFKGEYLALFLADDGSIKATHLSGDTTTLTGYVKLQTKVKLIGTSANATVALGNLATFSIDADDEWHTLEVFIKSGSTISTIKPEFTLSGSSSAIALFDEITFTQSNESAYKAATTSSTTKKADLSSTTADDEISTKSNVKPSTNWTTIFFIALSSALLVGAVLIAVVARAIKRLPKRTTVNLPTSGYNKNKKSSKK